METEKEINIWKVVEKKNAEEKEGKYLEKENIWRRKIFGQGRGRGTEKEKEENILEKESDDGQTNTQNFLLLNRFCSRGPAKHYVLLNYLLPGYLPQHFMVLQGEPP